MSSTENLTVIEITPLNNTENNIINETIKNDDLKLKLEENYYENLFLEEMEFRNNPNSSNIKKIIQKQCEAVEYFSSIGEDNLSKKYKLLNNIFLNDPLVINTLDIDNHYEDNCNNDKNNKNKMIIDILIKNKKIYLDKYGENDDIDDFNFNMNNINIINIINENEKNEKEKYDKLMKKNSFENNIESINLINNEIDSQKNNFKKNLTLKLQKKKSLNENKILQGIQNVFINTNNDNKEIKPENNNNSNINNNNDIINIEKKISPIKIENNSSSDKEISSNDIKFSSNEKNNDKINPLLNSANTKKNTSEFEPLTPVNKFEKNNKLSNELKSSAKQDISVISEEINETNDFTISNNDNENISNDKINKIEENNNNISNNISLSNINSNSITKSYESSSNIKENILKNFRLDFNDLFEYIKEHQNNNKKISTFCNDIKFIIENYINDFNQHLSKNVITKIIKKFEDIWDEMFKKYGEIYENYEKEIKEINIDETQNKEKIEELNNLIDNINIEKENALNQNEEKFNIQIESASQFFKNNYDKIDNGILLLNEKFAFMITKRVFDMINNN